MQSHFLKFFQLPPELWLKVYASIQWKARPGDAPLGGEAKTNCTLKLLPANKQINSEASALVFTERFLSFDLTGDNLVFDDEKNRCEDPVLALSKRLNLPCQDSFMSKVRNVRITMRQMTDEDAVGSGPGDDMRYWFLYRDLILICHTLTSQGCRLKDIVIETVCKYPLRCLLQLPRNTALCKVTWEKFQQWNPVTPDWPRVLEKWEAEERCFNYYDFTELISHLDLLRVSGSVEMLTLCTKRRATELYAVFDKLATVLQSNTPARKLNPFEKEYLEVTSRAIPYLEEDEEEITISLNMAWLYWYRMRDYNTQNLEERFWLETQNLEERSWFEKQNLEEQIRFKIELAKDLLAECE
ncbi:MAG: hypothetical protein Q9194_003040 [Teloschistes cf. exilis]